MILPRYFEVRGSLRPAIFSRLENTGWICVWLFDTEMVLLQSISRYLYSDSYSRAPNLLRLLVLHVLHKFTGTVGIRISGYSVPGTFKSTTPGSEFFTWRVHDSKYRYRLVRGLNTDLFCDEGADFQAGL